MQTIWDWTSSFGLRPLRTLRVWYTDTYFNFDKDSYPRIEGHVALTIDDGLCRQSSTHSMSDEVRLLLQENNAHATFFICSDYVKGDSLHAQAQRLLEDGNEIGNHCSRDEAEDGEFYQMSSEAFETELKKSSDVLEDILQGRDELRWFRAPSARYSTVMREAIERRGIKHALGDCYCDDWRYPDSEWVARTMLNQVQDGSIIIAHMPERGFREHCFKSLQLLLEGLSSRNLKAVTLSTLYELAEARN